MMLHIQLTNMLFAGDALLNGAFYWIKIRKPCSSSGLISVMKPNWKWSCQQMITMMLMIMPTMVRNCPLFYLTTRSLCFSSQETFSSWSWVKQLSVVISQHPWSLKAGLYGEILPLKYSPTDSDTRLCSGLSVCDPKKQTLTAFDTHVTGIPYDVFTYSESLLLL